MGQARDEAGNIWETDTQGNAVRLVQAAQAPADATVVPPDPVRLAQQQAEAARQAAADAASRADREADNARADRALAIAEERAAREASGAMTPAQRMEQQGRVSRLNQLAKQINRVQELYDAGPGTTDGSLTDWSGLLDYAPSDANARFDAAGAALSQQGLAAFRIPGSGTVSDRDAIMFDRANLPEASTRDAAIEEQLHGLRSRVEEDLQSLGLPAPEWKGVTDEQRDDPAALASALELPDSGTTPGAPTPLVGASGDTRRIRDDRLSAQVDAMINAGADEATINTVLTQQGWEPLPLGATAAARAWMRQNPGKRYFGANAERDVPLSALERVSGSPAGAFAANFANTATAGTAGALAGDRGKGALDAMSAMNPNASFGGSLAGGILGAGTAEMALAARAPIALARYAPRVADTLYGGLSGFNAAEEGQGGMGALTGAVAGGVGGAVGDRVMRGVGAVARGVTDPAVQRLRALNIPLTVGRAVGNSGPLGGMVKRMEEAATSIPGVGSQVSARFDDGLQGVNRAAFEIGAETTGGQVQDIGSAGLQQLRARVGQQYRTALDPVRLDIANDPVALADITNAQMLARTTPQVGEQADEALAYRIGGGMDDLGGMDGRDFQEAYRGLARDGRSAANGPYATEYAGAMREGQDALASTLERQNPGAFGEFQNANTANRRAMVLADAVNAAKNQNDEMFTPAQLNTADANSATRLTGRMTSASGQRPFYELAQDAQQIMGNRLPNSGTADRALATIALGSLGGAGLGAAGGYAAGDTGAGAGMGLGTILALLAGGSRPAQQLLTGALLNRPALLRTLGGRADIQSRLGGALGAGGAPLLVGTE